MEKRRFQLAAQPGAFVTPFGLPFRDALRLAAEIHHGQRRKGTDIAYVGHVISVCALRDDQLWNYRTLARIFAERREELGPEAAWLADELGRQVVEMERVVQTLAHAPGDEPVTSR